ncbi:MAG: RNA helicase [Propionibacterium sp.]|nr:MAG: RNA helicase [Propionibacterium sp.]
MCPTRELAVQVTKDLQLASKIRQVRILTIYGGVSYDNQLEALTAGVDVVVGTPGRLLDLVNRRALDLSQVKVVVLDEADEMLDLGFLPDVERLLGNTPGDRQTLLFSATMPAAIMALARSSLNRPVNIRAEGQDAQATVPDISQYIYQAHDLDKPEIIARVLQSNGFDKAIIFCRTKRAAQRLADDLYDRGFSVASIHGDLNQSAREKALRKFRNNKVTALVATDVAARGIDVTGISHVINYECPDNELTYIHRIGRTGRAGAKGVALTLVDWSDITRWKVINKALDLKQPEPVETYSTSEHLFSDLDIPSDVKSYIAEPKKERKAPSRNRNRKRTRRRGERNSANEAKTNETPKTDKPRRRRRRVRAGKVIREADTDKK